MSTGLSHLMIDDDAAMEDFGRIAAMIGMFPTVEEILQGKHEKAPSKDVTISIGYAISKLALDDLKCEYEHLKHVHGPVLPHGVLAAFQKRIENLFSFSLESMHPELCMMIGRAMIVEDRLPIDTSLPNFKRFTDMYVKQVIS